MLGKQQAALIAILFSTYQVQAQQTAVTQSVTCTTYSRNSAISAIERHTTSDGLIDEDRGNGEWERTRANPYGNSVDIIALVQSNPNQAKKTLEAWKKIYDYQIRTEKKFTGFYFFYGAGLEPLIDSKKDRKLTAQAAWVSLAIEHYQKKTGDLSFSKMREDINSWIRDQSHNEEGGVSMGTGTYHGDLGYGQKTKERIEYDKVFATEHNIDAYAALSRSSRQEDKTEAERLRQYLLKRHDPKSKMYDGGFRTSSERPLDAQTWMVLTLSESDRIKNIANLNASIEETLKKYEITADYKGQNVKGVHSGNGDVRGVWPEGTYGMILSLRALAAANDKAGNSKKSKLFREKANEYEKEMAKLQSSDGSFVYDTSGVWNEGKPFAHMSGTAWSLLVHEGVNPFNPNEKLEKTPSNLFSKIENCKDTLKTGSPTPSINLKTQNQLQPKINTHQDGSRYTGSVGDGTYRLIESSEANIE